MHITCMCLYTPTTPLQHYVIVMYNKHTVLYRLLVQPPLRSRSLQSSSVLLSPPQSSSVLLSPQSSLVLPWSFLSPIQQPILVTPMRSARLSLQSSPLLSPPQSSSVLSTPQSFVLPSPQSSLVFAQYFAYFSFVSKLGCGVAPAGYSDGG